MIRVNLFEFYELGAALSRLSTVQEHTELGTVFRELWQARIHLNRVLDSKIIPLGTSRKAGEGLRTVINRLWEPFYKSVIPDSQGNTVPLITTIVDWGTANAIETARSNFETVLAAEMPGLATYFVQKKALFDTVDLIANSDAIFSQDVLSRMPTQARKDICEAGKCLAFELYTATGFHIFRAMESVIVVYYKSQKKAPHLKDSDRNWGKYIDGLKTAGADPKITDYLTYFKNSHRNPVTHPETEMTRDEAIALFHALPNGIVPMINALPKKKVKKKLTPQLQPPPSLIP